MSDGTSENKGFEKLWAPWRMEYINGIDTGPSGCIFCDKPREDRDEKNLIVHRGETCFVILNLFPYNNGHLMVVPYSHTADMGDLDAATKLELMETATTSVDAMKKIMRPDGFNLGINLGRTAGAGIDEHLHLHVVPRWNGDTNFMPVIGSTKVISESLTDSYAKIRAAIKDVLAQR